MSFLRHAEIYRSDVVGKSLATLRRGAASDPVAGRSPRTAPCSSSAMSFRAGYSLAGCSPAEPASASPTALSIPCGWSAGNDLSANGNLSPISVSQHKGAVQSVPGFCCRSRNRPRSRMDLLQTPKTTLTSRRNQIRGQGTKSGDRRNVFHYSKIACCPLDAYHNPGPAARSDIYLRL